jgi:hypothetical protein
MRVKAAIGTSWPPGARIFRSSIGDGRQRDRHRHDRAEQLARGGNGRLGARLAQAQMALDVLHHDDSVVDHQPHRQHDGEDGEQVQAEAEGVHDQAGADQRHRHRHQRHHRRARRTHEQEHHQRDDQHGLGQRRGDVLQRRLHEHGAVVDQLHLDVPRQARAQTLHLGAQRVRHFDFVGADLRPHRQVDHLVPIQRTDVFGLLRAELDPRHVGEAHDRAVVLGDHQRREFGDRAQVGIGHQVHLHQIALGLAHRGEIVVALQRGVHVAGCQPVGGEAVGIGPDAHRQWARPFETDALHAGQRRELRLQRFVYRRGDMDIMPAGYADSWREDADNTSLYVSLAPRLMYGAAEALGLDPRRARIETRHQFRDSQIEHIAWALDAERRSGYANGNLYSDGALHAAAARRHPLCPAAHAPVATTETKKSPAG